MVDWKLYIDSPQKRVLDSCGGSLTEDDGEGAGEEEGYYNDVHGWGWGDGWGFADGDGHGDGHGWGDGNGGSATKW